MSVRPPARGQGPSHGFTLMELMISLAVVALLVAIAWPAYFEQIARGRRSDVQTELVEDANYMQRYYASNNTYLTATTLPITQSPKDGTANYLITIAQPPADTSFKLVATRQGPMANDKCGDFTYDNLGTKGLANTELTVPNCWR